VLEQTVATGTRQRRRRRYLLTRFGEMRFHRWQTRTERGYGYPLDEALGLAPGDPCSAWVRQMAAWLAQAAKALKGNAAVKPLKAAEAWLKEQAASIRNERFAPIKEKAQQIWSQLRLQSNVALEDIRLTGSAARRSVDLDVTVDGTKGAALGVMSQGEQNALALSLFIPRATLPESPFRFLVIDDPVQSMDPSRIDGLARVLHETAGKRQVVVFTHDDRLPEAVRRLAIPATVIEVTRREGSLVALRRAKDPVSRYIEDAITVAKTDDLPPQAARRVIPGLCRLAIDAACTDPSPVFTDKSASRGILTSIRKFLELCPQEMPQWPFTSGFSL